jgi:hypothetical protein
MISECLNQVADVELKKKLFDYDKAKYKEFNAYIMKDDGVHNIANEMKRL